MLRAVLFDLDGTLLDIELDLFLDEYFSALGPVLAAVIGPGANQGQALQAVLSGTRAMQLPHPGLTNQKVFNSHFYELTGTSLENREAMIVIERFYADEFPRLRGSHAPRPGAVEAVQAARDAGMATVVATNPIFPMAAIRERLRWADLDAESFDYVTSYELAPATKPAPEYYRHIAEKIGVEPFECLMVGDDSTLDMAAADIGMKTFNVGSVPVPSADWQGDLAAVRSLLLSLAPKG